MSDDTINVGDRVEWYDRHQRLLLKGTVTDLYTLSARVQRSDRPEQHEWPYLANLTRIATQEPDPAAIRRAVLLADLTAMANNLETGDDAEEDIALLLNNVAYAIHRGYVADLLRHMQPLTDAWLDGALREMPQDPSQAPALSYDRDSTLQQQATGATE